MYMREAGGEIVFTGFSRDDENEIALYILYSIVKKFS